MGQKAPVVRINLSNVPKNPAWYTVVTKFNYEKKFAHDLELGMKNTDLEEFIHEIVVPIKETTYKTFSKSGKEVEKIREEKIYPLYVFVKATMNEKIWDFLRTTNGCQTILATSGEPSIVLESDVFKIKDTCGLLDKEKKKRKENFNGSIGDSVNLIGGPFQGYNGRITAIHSNKSEVQILLDNGIPIKVSVEYVEHTK